MARSIYIRLLPCEVAALVRLAQVERRHPRDQGALLIVDGLRERGALPPEPTTADPEAPAEAPPAEVVR
jgi:hypothetical protein